MKYLILCVILLSSVACGRSDQSTDVAKVDPQNVADQAVVEAKEIVERAKQGEPFGATEGTEGCRIIKAGLIEEYFHTGETKVTYKGSIPVRRAGHVVCSASWDKPDKEQLEEASKQAMMDWAKAMASGDKTPQPKMASGTNRVSLTLIATPFKSSDDAIANLEESVATLSKGISFEVAGKQHETKMEFGPWIDGVGDKAIWSAKSGLNFVYKAKRYAVKVSVFGDEAQDREAAIGLAQRIIDTL